MVSSIVHSPTPFPAEPYIRRDETERALWLVAEGVVSVVQVCGVGGAGKSRTLTEVERRYAQVVRSAWVSFGLTEGRDGKFITEPIALMGHLFQQIDAKDGMLGDWGEASEFSTLYDRYYETLEKLKTESPEGGKANGAQKSLVESVAQIGKGLGDKHLGEGNGEIVAQGIGTMGQFWSLLRSHGSTKKDAALQALMQNPLPKLTEAFVSSLKAKAKRLPIALLLDTYEEAGTEIDRWLCGVLRNGEWAGARVQFVVAGRHRLSAEEHWRKLDQDRSCLREFGLGAFSRSQTEEYLGAIGLSERSDEIYGVTKGLLYYLNWIWKRLQSGAVLDFGAGNEEIVQLLLQGLSAGQRRLIELMACGRSFERATVQRLMGSCEIEGLPDRESAFGWLSNLSFVESVERGYRLDYVARDVFRLGLFSQDGEEFRRLNRLWAEDCLGQSEAIVEPEEPLSEQYGHPEWRSMRGDYLYHLALCGKKREVVAVWQKHLLEARYFNESDMLNLPLLEEPKELLEFRIREFLVEIRPAMVAGYAVLTKMPIDDAYNQREYEFSRGELDRSVQVCLAEIEKLEGLAKFSGLICLVQRGAESKRLEWLRQAQGVTEDLLKDESLEFASDLFLYKLGNGFSDIKAYEEAIVSYEKAIEIKPDYHEAWYNRGNSLDALDRREGAIVSYEKAIEFKPDYHEAWYNRGVSLNALGRREEAIASYEKAIEFKPDKHEAWYNCGNSLDVLGRREEAIVSFDKAIEFKPDYHKAWYNRGVSLNALGRREEAIASYEKAIEFKPDDHAAWYGLGYSLAALGRRGEAITSFDKAIELTPDKHQVWYGRGCLLSALGRKEEAIVSYDKAIEIKPDYHEAWYNRGISLAGLDRLEEAIVSYDKAIEIKSDNHAAWYGRGISLAGLDRKEEAIVSYDKAIEIKPDYHAAWYGRGVLLDDLGRREEAIASYEKAIEIKSDDHEAWYNRGYSLAALGRSEAAIDSYDKAIEFKLDDHEAWYNRGLLLFELDQKEAALDSYDKAIEIKPDDHEAWNGRGYSLAALGRSEEAIASYNKAIEIKPDDHAAWYGRGISLAALGRIEEAIVSYEKALEFKPNFHETWYNRGNLLDDLGRIEEAIESYDKAIEIKPDDATAFYNRACCHSLMGNLEMALADLTTSFRLDPEESRQIATTDSDLDPLRGDPGFVALMEEGVS